MRCAGHGCALPYLALVIDPAFGGVVDQHGGDHDDDHQDERQRRSVAHVEVVEGLFIEVVEVEIGGLQRAALGDDKGLGEDLEGIDQLDDQQKEEGRRQQGQGDAPEALPAVGAVELGGLVQMGRDVLQAGQVDHRAAAHAPDAHQRHRGQRPVRIPEPARSLDADHVAAGC